MKKVKSLCIVFFLLVIAQNALAQNGKSITYDMAKLSFADGTPNLPFDQQFDIKFINIGDTVTSFELAIWEAKKHKYDTTKQNDVSPEDTVYNNKKFLKNKDFTGTSFSTSVNRYLEPNSRYVVFVKIYSEGPLSDKGKDSVAKAVMENSEINELINQAIINNVMHPDSDNRTEEISKQFNQKSKEIIESLNSSYIVKDIDLKQQFDNIGRITSGSKNLTEIIEAIKNRYYVQVFNFDSLHKAGNTTQIVKDSIPVLNNGQAFLQTLSSVDWIAIKNDAGNTDYKNILAALDKLIKTNDSAVQKVDKDKGQTNAKKLDGDKTDFENALNEIIESKDEIINQITEIRVSSVGTGSSGGSTYPADFTEKAKQHITFDLGYAYVGGIDRGNAYAGMNIYFRGIDTSLPLKNTRMPIGDFIGSRISLLIGLSIESIQKDSVRKGLIGNNALITGVGFRLLPWFKINTGAYLYYRYPTNILYSKQRYYFTGSPFISLSIDFNLSTFFKTFGNGAIGNIFHQ